MLEYVKNQKLAAKKEAELKKKEDLYDNVELVEKRFGKTMAERMVSTRDFISIHTLDPASTQHALPSYVEPFTFLLTFCCPTCLLVSRTKGKNR
jgi:hypothetical protein